MRIKRLSSAFVVSVACHIVIAIIAGFLFIAQDRPDLKIGCGCCQPKEPPKPRPVFHLISEM